MPLNISRTDGRVSISHPVRLFVMRYAEPNAWTGEEFGGVVIVPEPYALFDWPAMDVPWHDFLVDCAWALDVPDEAVVTVTIEYDPKEQVTIHRLIPDPKAPAGAPAKRVIACGKGAGFRDSVSSNPLSVTCSACIAATGDVPPSRATIANDREDTDE